MRGETGLTARELLDALPARKPLDQAAARARVWCHTHRYELQRDIARVDRALGRVGAPRARAAVHADHRDGGYVAPRPSAALYERDSGAPPPEAGLEVVIAANAPPVAF